MGRKRNTHRPQNSAKLTVRKIDSSRCWADIIPADCWIYMGRMRDTMTSNAIWKHLVEQHFGVEWKEINTRREREPILQNLDQEGRFVEVYRHLLSLQESLIVPDEAEVTGPQGETDFVFKILLTGDPYTGKTTLLTRFSTGQFDYNSYNTIGVDFRVVRAKTRQGTPKALKGKLQVWDQGGRERFRAITRSYYKNVHAFLILFALDDNRSFNSAQSWYNEIIRNRDAENSTSKFEPVIMLVGTKSDKTAERQVSEEEAREFAAQLNIPYIETSAKTGDGVSKAFCTAASMVLQNNWQTFFEGSPRDRSATSRAQTHNNNQGGLGGIFSNISSYFKSFLGW